jgi:hypothetical protein
MSAVLTSPAQVVNYALRKAGYRNRVGSLYDGTDQAKAALDLYGQMRDAMLATGEWDFAQRTTVGTLLKQAPTMPPSYIVHPWTPAYPALPWAYEYAYPTDAVQIRAVKQQPVSIPNFDPRYFNFEVSNDEGFTPPQKVVLCNVKNAILVYAAQVTNPAQWNVAFLDALADRLADPLARVLTDMDHAKMAAMEKQGSTAEADMERG